MTVLNWAVVHIVNNCQATQMLQWSEGLVEDLKEVAEAIEEQQQSEAHPCGLWLWEAMGEDLGDRVTLNGSRTFRRMTLGELEKFNFGTFTGPMQ